LKAWGIAAVQGVLAAVLLATGGVAATPAQAGGIAEVCSAGLSGERHAGLDEDADAIPDSDDWCPDTPEGARVRASGCAGWEVPYDCTPPAPVAAPASAEPAAAAVPPADTDGDGVADAADQCAGTPQGLAVDASGCVQIEKIVLSGVSFEMGSARLKPEASATLRTVAAAMKASPAVNVEIGGYTDSIGASAQNQRLSERRAQSVKAFLVGEDIAAERLTTKGYGESDPVDTNDTPEGRANNRRVAFKVISP
jgi:OOP family OmpA-OmpF porin